MNETKITERNEVPELHFIWGQNPRPRCICISKSGEPNI